MKGKGCVLYILLLIGVNNIYASSKFIKLDIMDKKFSRDLIHYIQINKKQTSEKVVEFFRKDGKQQTTALLTNIIVELMDKFNYSPNGKKVKDIKDEDKIQQFEQTITTHILYKMNSDRTPYEFQNPEIKKYYFLENSDNLMNFLFTEIKKLDLQIKRSLANILFYKVSEVGEFFLEIDECYIKRVYLEEEKKQIIYNFIIENFYAFIREIQ